VGQTTELREYRLTFGIKYRAEEHPLFPAAHPDGWVAVMAPSYEDARDLVIRRLGREWAFLYLPGELRESYFPAGEIERWSTTGAVSTDA
jgi:hypothetical protein